MAHKQQLFRGNLEAKRGGGKFLSNLSETLQLALAALKEDKANVKELESPESKK